MPSGEVRASGLEALSLATRLLQRARLADPEAGLWEAADVQWWWRRPRASDTLEQLFWIDEEGPVAAVLLTDWGRSWSCDPIIVPGVDAVGLETVWDRAAQAVDAGRLHDVEVLARDDDRELQRMLAATGFAPGEGQSGVTWMLEQDRPPVAPVPPGFVLVDRAEHSLGPHPVSERSGSAAEARLRQTSLYDPRLDLAIRTGEGDVAAYALFWFDPVTSVGLVEPLRVEDAYQRLGLGRGLLTTGLDRLARRGARRFKVGYGSGPARTLYLAAGFRLSATISSYRRQKTQAQAGRWRSAGPT